MQFLAYHFFAKRKQPTPDWVPWVLVLPLLWILTFLITYKLFREPQSDQEQKKPQHTSESTKTSERVFYKPYDHREKEVIIQNDLLPQPPPDTTVEDIIYQPIKPEDFIQDETIPPGVR